MDKITPSQQNESGGDTRQRILQAATQVFSERGYKGATTKEIATVAGVNEVTLFRHFGNKVTMMRAVIERNSALPGIDVKLRNEFTGDLRHDLTLLGTHFLRTMIKNRKQIVTAMSEAQRLPELQEAISQVPIQQQQMLANYMRQQIEDEVIRPVDPAMAVQTFFGMLFSHAMLELVSVTPYHDLPVEDVVAFYVDVFIGGLAKHD